MSQLLMCVFVIFCSSWLILMSCRTDSTLIEVSCEVCKELSALAYFASIYLLPIFLVAIYHQLVNC